jgi:hypothetical protein
MRLSLVFLNAARRGTAFFVIVEAKTKFSLPSPNGSVDQRKSPSCYARIGSCGPRVRLIAFAQAGSVQPQLSDVARIRAQLITFHALGGVRQHGNFGRITSGPCFTRSHLIALIGTPGPARLGRGQAKARFRPHA